MYRNDIPMTFGGQAVAMVRYSILFSDLTGASGTTLTVNLTEDPNYDFNPTTYFVMPPGARCIGLVIHPTVQFVGTGITNLTVSVGNAAQSATYYSGPAVSVWGAVSDSTLTEIGPLFKRGLCVNVPTATSDPQVFFTSTGGNLSALTAGSVDVYVLYYNVTQPVYAPVVPQPGSVISQP